MHDREQYRQHTGMCAFGQSGIRMVFLLALLSSCGKGFKSTDGGLEYKIIVQGDEKALLNGEYLLYDLLIKTSSDSMMYSSANAGVLFPLKYDTYRQKVGQRNLLEEGLLMMHKGDSMVFAMKASAFAQAFDMTFRARPDDRLLCHAKLVDVMNYADYSTWKATQLARKKSEHETFLKKAMERESKKIDSILTLRDTPYAVSISGIRYVIEREGMGQYPRAGDSVFFNYHVTYLDGTALPNNLGNSGDSPRSFRMGSDGVLESWQESITLLKKGGAGAFYISSPLAFGDSEAPGIVPNAVLIINLELVDVKKN